MSVRDMGKANFAAPSRMEVAKYNLYIRQDDLSHEDKSIYNVWKKLIDTTLLLKDGFTTKNW
jgi:hypothetical protein